MSFINVGICIYYLLANIKTIFFFFGRCVSSIQAATATVVGLIIAVKCQKDIMMDR